jgi:hypothetical protein
MLIGSFMQESELIHVISLGKTNYRLWTIGITDDPKRRRSEHDAQSEDTKSWRDWQADTEAIARNVEKYFLDKGMNGSTGGGEHPTYVYVF